MKFWGKHLIKKTLSYGIRKRKAWSLSLSRLSCFQTLLIFTFFITLMPPSSANAATCVSCTTVTNAHNTTRSHIRAEHLASRTHVTTQFELHKRDYWVEFYWKDHILASMMMMTEQFTTTAMHQVFAIGTLFDAAQQLETQQVIRAMNAKAHRRYHPDNTMCTFGTMSTSVAAAQHIGEYVSFEVSQAEQDRQLSSVSAASFTGTDADKHSRILQFQNKFCRKADNNGNLDLLCKPGSGTEPTVNADINYPQTVGNARTVPKPSSSEGDALYAMASNLFAHNVIMDIPKSYFQDEDNHDFILDVRAITAKRSVAQSSFNSIVGMKVEGPPQSVNLLDYTTALMETSGFSEDDVKGLYGEKPSYYAQMEVLTKRIYQRPEFYTDLYTTPENVERQAAAMKAVSLMQNVDMLKSQLRQEAILAVILETSLEDTIQGDIERGLPDRGD